MEKFEEYFQRADVDRDGRISEAEAVSFLLGSNLPRPVLAQIWNLVDQNRSGFLSRPEFYNALKLVTVSQSKRDLTPDIVRTALYGPASSKIPPPQIYTAATTVQQPNSVATSPLPQTGLTPQPSQNFGFRGPAPSNTSISQQVGALPSSTGMRPVGSMHSISGQSPHYGLAPSTSGVNQHLAQARPSNIMIQQLGQVQPMNMMMNQQFGQLQLQPSSTGINQQFRPPSSTTNMNQQFFPSQGSQTMRPSQSMPILTASRPPQANISRSIVGSSLPNVSIEMLGGKTGAASTGQVTQGLDKGARSSSMPVAPNPQDLLSSFSSSASNDDRGLVRSASDPMFVGGSFSAIQTSPQQVSPVSQPLTSSLPTSSVVSPVTSSSQSSVKLDPFETLQSTLMKPSSGIQASERPSLPKSNQQTPNQVNSSALSPGVQATVGNSTSEQLQMPWPKMTRAGIHKYAKVFMEVDSDRDGKITGDQARNLFLSWRLPREVLKQVWDLADQDSDSMLSLREFCIALYLMERYREGHSLPPTLPNSVMLDETLLSLAGPPSTYGSIGWATATGLRPQQALPTTQPIAPASGRSPMQPVISQTGSFMQFNQKNARGPLVDNFHANQPSNGEAHTMGLEAEETNEKADGKDNLILDSREKLEFYRTKMQDLVLYKSRYDNRLNEITERARADKTEAELLDKKYQEKYKQVAEIHSKLTIEEATFREIQERKTELQQAITKMEQGGSADGILQVRADRLQSDLEELLKALTERCKKHSMEIQSSSVIVIPTGWQPGIPEAAAVWDEAWDKFEDGGFSFDIIVPANVETKSDHNGNASPTRSLSPDSVTNAAMSDKLFGLGAFDTESLNSADESRSPRGSPGRQTIPETPSQEHSVNHFRKSSDGDTETHRSFDDSTWGNFDNNDDVDSTWGFNSKDSDHGKHDEKYFFGSTDFGVSPRQRGSPHADSAFEKSSPFTFEDSVPGSPVSRAGHSPRYSVDSRDPFYENFSRFDSFRTNDVGSSSRPEGLTRFDSISSTREFDHSSNYSFDDSDPFGSSGPFKVSSETSKKDSEGRSAF